MNQNHPSSLAGLLCALCVAGCGGEEAERLATGDGDIPTAAAAMFTFLKENRYADFEKESAVHASTGPHGQVRVYISDALDQSLAADDGDHPAGAAAIKELYENDGTTLKGWAVMVKVKAESDQGKGWYWYEVFSTEDGSSPAVDGDGDDSCTSCHSSGRDFFRTPYPLD